MNPSWFLMLSLVPGNPPTAPVPPVWPMQAGPNCPPGSRAILGQPCPPIGPPAPVLAIKLLGPAGSRVQWLPGTNAPTQPTPATAAVRPGYRYVAALSQLPGRDPAVTVYPVLEVLGSLAPRTTMNPMEYPAPFALSEADVQVALSGGLVTKFIYLEDPTKAVPVAAKPDQPLEFTDLNERDAEAAARANGRLVAILRLGDRAPDPEHSPGPTGRAPSGCRGRTSSPPQLVALACPPWRFLCMTLSSARRSAPKNALPMVTTKETDSESGRARNSVASTRPMSPSSTP